MSHVQKLAVIAAVERELLLDKFPIIKKKLKVRKKGLSLIVAKTTKSRLHEILQFLRNPEKSRKHTHVLREAVFQIQRPFIPQQMRRVD
ncbi:hypothetical protein T12_13991 [Trichinella patagoniensis]|uniref:Uncharacterized protein n=1 Tax=Trichinella patagoniensis TaxID=990121 RepID=A0A0V0ZRG0_9BILA|nr:hypothetical protein T12_13991 [Trichinella patagoniensis]